MKQLAQTIRAYEKDGLSWAEISERLYPNEDKESLKALLWKIARTGYYPRKASTRRRLGLAPIKVIETCPTCGVVHLAKTCPAKTHRKRPDKHSISLPDDVWEWLRRNGNASGEIARMARKEMSE